MDLRINKSTKNTCWLVAVVHNAKLSARDVEEIFGW